MYLVILKKLLYKYLYLIGLILILLGVRYYFYELNNQKIVKIALIIPDKNLYIYKLALSFKKNFSDIYKEKYEIVEFHSYGNNQILSNHVNFSLNEKFDLYVTVGLNATRIFLQLSNGQQKLVYLGGHKEYYDYLGIEKMKSSIGIDDYISVQDSVSFIKQIVPLNNNFLFIVSEDEFILNYLQLMMLEISKYKGNINSFSATSLADIYKISSYVHNLKNKISAIVVLKDDFVVSNIDGIVKIAENLKIPLIVFDEGSVEKGASIGYGTDEENIGMSGAVLTKQMLENNILLNVKNNIFYIFLNKNTIVKQGLNKDIANYFRYNGYSVLYK